MDYTANEILSRRFLIEGKTIEHTEAEMLDSMGNIHSMRHIYSDGNYEIYWFEEGKPYHATYLQTIRSGMPRIYSRQKNDEGEFNFQIETTAHGAMTENEIRNMLNSYESALDALSWIRAVFAKYANKD